MKTSEESPDLRQRPIADEEIDEPIRLIATVLTRSDGVDRIVAAYEEYGDQDNESLCEDILKEVEPYLLPNEKLRVVTYDVDVTQLVPFKFPFEKDPDDRPRRRYAMLHDARDTLTIIITWSHYDYDYRELYCWDLDQGDASGMFDRVLPYIEDHDEEEEQLYCIAYQVPLSALREAKEPTGDPKDTHLNGSGDKS